MSGLFRAGALAREDGLEGLDELPEELGADRREGAGGKRHLLVAELGRHGLRREELLQVRDHLGGRVLAERLAGLLDCLLAEGLELADEFLARLAVLHLSNRARALREHLGGEAGVRQRIGGERAEGHAPLLGDVGGGVARQDREVVEGELERRAAEERGLRGKRLELREARLRGAETLGVRGGLQRGRSERRGGLLAKA